MVAPYFAPTTPKKLSFKECFAMSVTFVIWQNKAVNKL